MLIGMVGVTLTKKRVFLHLIAFLYFIFLLCVI